MQFTAPATTAAAKAEKNIPLVVWQWVIVFTTGGDTAIRCDGGTALFSTDLNLESYIFITVNAVVTPTRVISVGFAVVPSGESLLVRTAAARQCIR